MTDNHNGRREGASAIGHVAIGGIRQVRALAIHGIVDLLAIAVLASVMGGTSSAAFLAIAIVVGAEIGLRKYEQRNREKFGETARGTEVQDHTQGGDQ